MVVLARSSTSGNDIHAQDHAHDKRGHGTRICRKRLKYGIFPIDKGDKFPLMPYNTADYAEMTGKSKYCQG